MRTSDEVMMGADTFERGEHPCRLSELQIEVLLDIRDALASRGVEQPPAVCTGTGTTPIDAGRVGTSGLGTCGICSRVVPLTVWSVIGYLCTTHPYRAQEPLP